MDTLHGILKPHDMDMPQVIIIMGSKSDKEKMGGAVEILQKIGIPYEAHIFSAHRTPEELDDFLAKMGRTVKVIIAGAVMSAALAGHIVAKISIPVIGVPLSGGKHNGEDAMLSTLEMPPGYPVLTVGIDSSKNAGIAAACIIGLLDDNVARKLSAYRSEMRRQVLKDDLDLSM